MPPSDPAAAPPASPVAAYDDGVVRCPWADPADPLYVAYHDREWGVPLHDDQALFELLILEGAQAGLSWRTVLHKRESYRRAFAGFDPEAVAGFEEEDVQRLLADPGVIRHEGKIRAAIGNAEAFQVIQEQYGSFDAYLWRFVGGAPKRNAWTSLAELPAATVESEALSRDLQKRGMKFVGPTIVYAFMQATGMVNDHLVSCFRYDQV